LCSGAQCAASIEQTLIEHCSILAQADGTMTLLQSNSGLDERPP
jgi:hypothetical protein